MTNLLQSAAFWLVTLVILSFKSNARDSGAHRWEKALNFCCAAFLVLFHSTAFLMLGWAVGHPDRIIPEFYVTRDLFLPWASLSVWALNTIVSVLASVVGCGLAARKNRSRIIFLRLFPVMLLTDWLEAFKGAMSEPKPLTGYLVIGAFLAVITLVPYTLIALFYTRKRVVDSLFSPPTAKQHDGKGAQDMDN
jgi:hypothetical protein